MSFETAIGIRFPKTDVWASVITITTETAGAIATGAFINAIPLLKNNLGLVDKKTTFLAGLIFGFVLEAWRGVFIRHEDARKAPPLIANFGILPATAAAFLATKTYNVSFNNPLVGLIALLGSAAFGWAAKRFHGFEIDGAVSFHSSKQPPTTPPQNP